MNDELLKRLIDVLERVERHLATPVATPTPTDTKTTPGRDTRNAEKCRKYRARKRVADTGVATPDISLSLVSKKEASKKGSKKEPRSEIKALGKNWPRDFREQFWSAYPKKVEKPYALECLEKVRRSGVEFVAVMAGIARIDRSDPKFIKNPATWLRRGCWTDGEGAAVEGPAVNHALLEEFHRASLGRVNGAPQSNGHEGLREDTGSHQRATDHADEL